MEKNEQVHLDRSIDLFSALALVIGTVIGSGIFFKQASVLSYSHSTTMALLAWPSTMSLSLRAAMARVSKAVRSLAYSEIPSCLFSTSPGLSQGFGAHRRTET